MNVGSEFGGLHFAVVVDLGVIAELNTYRQKGTQVTEKRTRAIIKQIRSISKLRIYHPKKRKDTLYRLSSKELGKIYKMMIDLYSSKY